MNKTYDIVIKHKGMKTFLMSAQINSTAKGEGYILKNNIVYPAYFHQLKFIERSNT